ncbi:hypothetical protein PR048_016671 [Dryococelus australis]|uniref:Uncharacterized protein n=1 Tax=Dryococelus australis TaxID=614101 RepID=A0ABQ9H7E0_9NEOP|nr:hypothetical protein PR048_016671 [Dryococelus australis]
MRVVLRVVCAHGTSAFDSKHCLVAQTRRYTQVSVLTSCDEPRRLHVLTADISLEGLGSDSDLDAGRPFFGGISHSPPPHHQRPVSRSRWSVRIRSSYPAHVCSDNTLGTYAQLILHFLFCSPYTKCISATPVNVNATMPFRTGMLCAMLLKVDAKQAFLLTVLGSSAPKIPSNCRKGCCLLISRTGMLCAMLLRVDAKQAFLLTVLVSSAPKIPSDCRKGCCLLISRTGMLCAMLLKVAAKQAFLLTVLGSSAPKIPSDCRKGCCLLISRTGMLCAMLLKVDAKQAFLLTVLGSSAPKIPSNCRKGCCLLICRTGMLCAMLLSVDAKQAFLLTVLVSSAPKIPSDCRKGCCLLISRTGMLCAMLLKVAAKQAFLLTVLGSSAPKIPSDCRKGCCLLISRTGMLCAMLLKVDAKQAFLLTVLGSSAPKIPSDCRKGCCLLISRTGMLCAMLLKVDAKQAFLLTVLVSSALRLDATQHFCSLLQEVTMAEWLACSPPTKTNRVQSPAGQLPDFRKWESCRTMPLVGEFSRRSPVSPAPSFRRCSILPSLHTHREVERRNTRAGGTERSPRKSVNQRYRPARFPHVRIRERPSSGIEPWFAVAGGECSNHYTYLRVPKPPLAFSRF